MSKKGTQAVGAAVPKVDLAPPAYQSEPPAINLSHEEISPLEWVNLMQELERERPSQEAFVDKMKRKFKSEPLVPIGK